MFGPSGRMLDLITRLKYKIKSNKIGSKFYYSFLPLS